MSMVETNSFVSREALFVFRCQPIGRRPGIATSAALVVLVSLGAGCSSGSPNAEPSVKVTSLEPTAEPVVETQVVTGKLRGTLTKAGREEAVQEVAEVVDTWIDQAWLDGPWPREIDGVWGTFTPGAARLAQADAAMTSAAGYGPEAESVLATKRRVKVDLLGRRLDPVGATARISLHLEVRPVDAPDEPRDVRLRGRVMLTPTTDGWKIFGHELVSGGWS